MRYLSYILGILLLILYASCSKSPTISAGSSVTGNAKISGTVLDNNGIPIEGVDVVLRRIKLTEIGDSIIFEKHYVSQENGFYIFDSLRQGKYSLLCFDTISKSIAIRQKNNINTDSEHLEVNICLKPSISVFGKLIVDSVFNLNKIIVTLPSSGRNFYLDSMGNFKLNNVPQDSFDIAFIWGGYVNFITLDLSNTKNDSVFLNDIQFAKNLSLSQGYENYYLTSFDNSFKVTFIETQNQALLFDDFEKPLLNGIAHNSIYNKLSDSVDARGGKWVVRPNADGHTVTPAIFPDNFDSCIITSGAFKGKSLRIFINFNQGYSPTGGIGVDIGSPQSYYDLSKMTEFSFYAKGSGRMRVVFHTDTVGSGEGEFIYEFNFPSRWERIFIKSTDLVARTASQTQARGITWQKASRGVTSISFFALEDVTFYIDDIYMFGITLNDIVKTSPGNQMP
jgi:hypothetical protein